MLVISRAVPMQSLRMWGRIFEVHEDFAHRRSSRQQAELVQLDRIRQIALRLLERARFAPAQRLGPLLPAPLAVGALDRHE